MAKAKEFPKVRGLYKKKTANGTRYVLHGSKKDGGKTIDFFVTVPISDRDSVATFYEKVQAAREELNAKINPPKTIAYYIEQYAMKRSLSQGSIWQYNHALKGFTLDVDEDDRLVAEILARTDIKDTSKKRMIGIINTFFKYLVQIGVVKRNPAAGIRVGRWQRRTRLPTNEEIEKILLFTDTNGNDEDALFLRLLLATGARCSTLEIVRIGDMSDDGHLSLYNVKASHAYDRAILITDPVIRSLWATVAGERDPSEPLFGHGEDALRVSRRLRNRMLRMFEPDLDGQRISPHSFRHLFGCRLLERGASIDTVATLLDHQSSSITYQYYAKQSQQKVDEAVEAASFSSDEFGLGG